MAPVHYMVPPQDAPGTIFRRSEDSGSMVLLTVVVLGLFFVGLLLGSILFAVRRWRRQEPSDMLPTYQEFKANPRNHHNLTIQTNKDGHPSVLYIGQEGRTPMLQNPSSAPYSPENIPEIHITFPDEQDEGGRRQSGRVLVVRVGDGGAVGLEPVDEEQLPAYEKGNTSQFYSVDLDSIGGLREKTRSN